MSKNIWILNQYTGSPYHGMNYRSYYLAKGLIKEGERVTIFSGSYSHLFSKLPKIDGLFTKEKIDNIDYIWVKTPKYKSSKSIGRIVNMLSFMFKLFLFNTKELKKPDVIIVSSLSLFPIINGYLWSKKFKTKLIFEIRDLWPQTLIELGNVSKNHPLVLFLGFFEKFGYKRANYVVSLLANAKEYMVSRGMSEDKFVYIPNGITLDEVENAEPLNKDVLNLLPKDKFLVGYVGTIGIANALDYLLESAKKLKENKDIHFVIVGQGSEKDRLKEFVQNNSLDNVTFIDPIPKRKVQSMLKNLDVCYIGLKKEPLFKYGVSPNKLFDYMYSAKPVLYAIDSGEQNIVKDAKCGVCAKAEDSTSIKEAILKLYQMDKKERELMGKNGREYVVKHHSYDNLAKKYQELF